MKIFACAPFANVAKPRLNPEIRTSPTFTNPPPTPGERARRSLPLASLLRTASDGSRDASGLSMLQGDLFAYGDGSCRMGGGERASRLDPSGILAPGSGVGSRRLPADRPGGSRALRSTSRPEALIPDHVRRASGAGGRSNRRPGAMARVQSAMRRQRRRKRSSPPLVCRLVDGSGRACGAPIAWIPGVSYPVNPGSVEILLYEEGSPRIQGVTIKGDECWGRRREPGEDGRVVEIWTRHQCDFAGRPAYLPPDPEAKWGIDRSVGGDE